MAGGETLTCPLAKSATPVEKVFIADFKLVAANVGEISAIAAAGPLDGLQPTIMPLAWR